MKPEEMVCLLQHIGRMEYTQQVLEQEIMRLRAQVEELQTIHVSAPDEENRVHLVEPIHTGSDPVFDTVESV